MSPPLEISEKLPPHIQPWAQYIAFWSDVYSLDPFILAAICDRESQGGAAAALDKQGPGGRGDGGHGHGLFQIDDRSHSSMLAMKLGDGAPAWANAVFNTGMGASILAAALAHFEQDYPAAICAYNAGPGAARHALTPIPLNASVSAKVAALDAMTTGGDYVSDVLRRRAEFAGFIAPSSGG